LNDLVRPTEVTSIPLNSVFCVVTCMRLKVQTKNK
jgi:hypothetical protein